MAKKRKGFIFKNTLRGARFPLVDVEEPELFRRRLSLQRHGEGQLSITRSSRSTPRTRSSSRIRRSGTASSRGLPFPSKQIEELFNFLHRLSGPNGVIRQSEFFLYTEKDKEAVTKCLEKGYRYPEITGWIRANKDDLQLVKEFGLKETGMLTSSLRLSHLLQVQENEGRRCSRII